MKFTAYGLAGVFGVLMLAANACGSEPRGEPTVTTATTTRQAASYEKAPCPNPIYPGAPQADLGPSVDCGYLTVPENRADQNSKTIRLLVATIKSTAPNPKPDPVVYLAGGPGNPSVIHDFNDWRLDRDLILIGQRGTMKDDPFLSCPEVDQFLAEAVGIGAQDPAYAEKSAAALHACRDRLTGQGINLAAYNSTESAADVADLRVAMGIDEWNIYGLSYGTDLALQTVRAHPEGIRSVVLDSVLPPQANIVESGWPQGAHSFSAIFDGCAAEPACAQAFPDVRSEFTRLVKELSANPLRLQVDNAAGQPTVVVIDGYKLASGVVVAAAQTPGQLARIPAMIHKLATGDPTDVAKALTALVPPNLLGYGLMYSVLCSESVSRTDAEQVLAAGKQALPDFPDAVLAAPAQVPSLFSDCETWSVPAAPASVSSPVRSDVQVLLASGSFDSATPSYFADEAAKTLPNSRHLVFPGSGHEVAVSTPDAAKCFLDVIRGFYDNPADYNTDCVGALRIPAFVID